MITQSKIKISFLNPEAIYSSKHTFMTLMFENDWPPC